MRFKTLRGIPKGKAQKGQYLLVVALGRYKWYQSQTLGGVSARTLGSQGVDCEIPHRLEWGMIPYKGVETFPQWTHFKTLRGSPKGITQRGQYLLAVALSRYTSINYMHVI